MRSRIWLGGFCVLLMGATIAACAADGAPRSDGEGGGGDAVTTSTGAQGGSGGDAQGGGGSDPCANACATVQPPACHIAVCNDGSHPGPVGECVVVPATDGTDCDDGLFCTTADTCQAGVCVGGPPNDCGMTAPECEVVTCDETIDGCTTEPGPNGDPCVGDDLCMLGATCNNGVCVGGTPNDCFLEPVPDECHVSVCNPNSGLCEPVPGNDGGACTDQNDLCTVGKTCTAGQCQGGSPKDCSILTQGCDMGVCDASTGQCTTMAVGEGQSCNDLDACTTGEICTAGVCGSGAPVTTCAMVADGCCPANCDETNDFDCAFSCELHAITNGRIIYHMDKTTGALTQVGTAGTAASTTAGLAQDPVTKTVYLTSTGNDSLFTIDLTTGAVTLVGAYGDSAVVMHGLEWNPDNNTLYGYSSHNNGLYTIDTTTGAATLVGTTGLTSFGNLGYDSTNHVMYLTSSGDDSAYTIDLTTGTVTLLGPLNGPTNPHGLAYDPSTDQLFVADPGTDTLYVLDRATGAAIPVGVFGSPNLLGLVCYSE